MREKVVLVGAGSAMFTRGLVADLIDLGESVDLRLVDVAPDALQVSERLTSKMIAARRAPIGLKASTDRRDVLPGATTVICTIGVGGRRAWEQDVLIPRRYGIYQPVGDSVMPGGASRALRMVPAMAGVAEDLLDLAPRALFFNYGNPMAPVCRGVRKATGANIVGLCHGVPGVASFLAKELGVDPKRFNYRAVGMNHLTWFVETRVDDGDAMPRLLEIARHKLQDQTQGSLNPFSWRLLTLFGAFPAVLDRHVSEFFPQFYADGQYYGKTLGVDVFSFEDTISRGDRIFEEMRERAMSPDPLPDDYFEHIGGEHEQVVSIIGSIRRNSSEVYSVNLPNRGQVPNLPAGAIIESPACAQAVAEGGGLEPIQQPPLPSGLVGTLAARFAWVETVVEAALEGDRGKFVQALVVDGSVGSLEIAENLADDLLAAQSEYLPLFVRSKEPGRKGAG